MGLGGNSVLVGLDGVRGVEDIRGWMVLCRRDGLEERDHRGIVSVDGRDNGNVVLKLVEFIVGCRCYGDSRIERINEGGIVRAKGHFADDV